MMPGIKAAGIRALARRIVKRYNDRKTLPTTANGSNVLYLRKDENVMMVSLVASMVESIIAFFSGSTARNNALLSAQYIVHYTFRIH